MSVFRRDDKLYLRRMTERAPHTERCLFFKASIAVDTDYTDLENVTAEQDAAISERLKAAKGVFPAPTQMPSFYALPSEIGVPEGDPNAARATDDSAEPDARRDESRLDREPSCARMLNWYVHTAGLNVSVRSAPY